MCAHICIHKYLISTKIQNYAQYVNESEVAIKITNMFYTLVNQPHQHTAQNALSMEHGYEILLILNC